MRNQKESRWQKLRNEFQRLILKPNAKKAKRYVKNKDLSKKANDEMRYYNAAMKINRLELLKANIGMHLVGSYDELEKIFGDAFTQRTEEEMRKQAGILGKTIQNNGEKAEVIVNASYKKHLVRTYLGSSVNAKIRD